VSIVKKVYAKYIIGIFVIAVTVGFIFLQSTDSKEKSGEKSEKVQTVITEITHAETTKSELFFYQLRKSAHIAEYSALGIELALFILLVCGGPTLQRIINALSFGMAIGVADEAIQILSDRGSLVSDVLIDTAGIVGGVALVMLIYAAVQLIMRKKRKNMCGA
jgi:VanZ family protein